MNDFLTTLATLTIGLFIMVYIVIESAALVHTGG